MKSKDIMPIIIMAVISSIFALVLSNMLFGSPKARKQTAETVGPISADFQTPDSRYFNSNAVNPTQIIRIQGGNNNTPFSIGD